MSDESDKRHEATPHRREEYRKQGKFARARDAGAVAAIGACVGVLAGTHGAMGATLHTLFARTLGDVGALTRNDPSGLWWAGHALVLLALPIAVGSAVIAAAFGFAQAGVHIVPELVSFKAERLDPFARLKQMLSPKHGTVETLLALARVSAVGYVGYRAARQELPTLLSLCRFSVAAGAEQVTASVMHVTLSCLGALAATAVVDWAQSRWSLEKEMRMSAREQMDEARSQEGDPKQRGRLRARARALAKKRAVTNVRSAAVVVTNPTHIAIALRYEKTDVAPIVIAKGHDDVALRIRAEARKHGIPVLENKRLARALDAEVPLGHFVPAAHFVAVARVLAFVMRLRQARGVREQAP